MTKEAYCFKIQPPKGCFLIYKSAPIKGLSENFGITYIWATQYIDTKLN